MALLGGYKGGGAQTRYLGTSSTQNGFVLTDGRYGVTNGVRGKRLTGTGTGGGEATASHEIIELTAERGLRLGFVGVGANDTTFLYRLWAVKYVIGADGQIEQAKIRYMGGGTATLSSTLVGFSGTSVLFTNGTSGSATEYAADTLTWTVGTVGAASGLSSSFSTIITANGAPGTVTVYNPGGTLANCDEAMLIVPDGFDHDGIVVEFSTGGSATSCNCVYERTR